MDDDTIRKVIREELDNALKNRRLQKCVFCRKTHWIDIPISVHQMQEPCPRCGFHSDKHTIYIEDDDERYIEFDVVVDVVDNKPVKETYKWKIESTHGKDLS